ncbi:NAD-dependent epimerase/dehydratase family protein [Streptomyces sp. NPDC087894]|uniref:NAD-dependent epimerase/dehydratase family protein n=1 Tax=Streptomyces sp. NPDC087894 TaxID=3365816 RepID=UPI0037FC8812
MSTTVSITARKTMHLLVTGATGWIGSALVPQLIAAGHRVTATTRSDAAADVVRALGAEPVRGDLEDPGSLRRAAEASGGVIHLAYRHDVAFTTDPAGAAETEYQAVKAMGEALTGTQRPFVMAVGLAGLPEGQVAAWSPSSPPVTTRPDTAGALTAWSVCASPAHRRARARPIRPARACPGS